MADGGGGFGLGVRDTIPLLGRGHVKGSRFETAWKRGGLWVGKVKGGLGAAIGWINGWCVTSNIGVAQSYPR